MAAVEDGRPRRTAAAPLLDTQNVFWYFGALAGTAACIALAGQVPESARGLWILLVSLAFLAAYGVGVVALQRAGWLVSAGVLAATAVTFVPIAGAAFERLVGITSTHAHLESPVIVAGDGGPAPLGVQGGDTFSGSAFVLALLTVVAGLVVYRLVRYAYVFLWVAVAALVATQILVPAFDAHPGADGRFDAALATGILFVILGLLLDANDLRRQAFWWHVVALAAVTSALAYHTGFHRSGWWIADLAAGLAALAVAAVVERATFAFFGLLGLYAPFVHWSGDWFGNVGTALALAVVGFSILALGILVQREQGRLARLRPSVSPLRPSA
jgi:hypothetical protein